MMFDVKVKAQFQPSSAADVRAVVLAKRKTPVIAGARSVASILDLPKRYSPVEMARLPLRPR